MASLQMDGKPPSRVRSSIVSQHRLLDQKISTRKFDGPRLIQREIPNLPFTAALRQNDNLPFTRAPVDHGQMSHFAFLR